MSESIGPDDPVGYIQHHLINLTVGEGFWTVNIDTLFFSWLIGGLLVFLAWKVGRNLNPDNPTGVQNLLESILEFVDNMIKEIFPVSNPLIGPLAITVFLWVFLMNAMDLIPVDLLPTVASHLGVPHLKVVPTTDPNATLGMALMVFMLVVYYNIKVKGLWGYVKTFLTHPFGIWLFPVNAVMTLVEELAKPLSLGLLLFGNLFCRRVGISLSGFATLVDTIHSWRSVGNFSYFGYYIAGFYFYGVDNHVPGTGSPKSG